MREGSHGQAHLAGPLRSHYAALAVNLALSAVAMYFVMYTMIDRPADLYNNINNAYMTGMMVAPMAILMLLMMRSMYTNSMLNLVLHGGFALLFVLCFFGMRTQALVGDRQFLRAMIPHHSGAVLMCEQASIRDAEIQTLCRNIISGQKAEIEQMKMILKRK